MHCSVFSRSVRLLICSAVSLVASESALAQSIVRGPYLQMLTPESVIVRWRTDAPTESVVGVAVTDGAPASVADAAVTTEHELLVSGLSPNTRYNYTVGTSSAVLAGGDLSSNGDGEHFFTTAPISGTDKDMRIWVIGDSGTANANAAAVRDAYKSYTGARGADFWLMLGDNAYQGGTDAEYQAAVFDMYPQILRQTPVWSAFGNHDAADVFFYPPGAYPQIFSFPEAGEAGGVPSGSEYYYSFDYGNVHVVVLDSTTGDHRAVGSAMWSWLESDLQANQLEWVIAIWHHPEYSKGSHDSDAEVALIDMRSLALPLLENYGVDLILTGHSHSYERSYLISGHYGDSSTLAPAMILDNGDGAEDGDGIYVKPGAAGTPGEGAVHAVVGSSGKVSNAPLDHAVMAKSMLRLGSMVVDISGNRLDAKFVDSTSVVRDEFSIIKAPPQQVSIDVQPWDPANVVKPNSTNNIPVSIQGMSLADGDAIDFDATRVDVATVRFGRGEAHNVVNPWVADIDGDSHTDMVLAFPTQEADIFCDDTEVSLEGTTVDGLEFAGTDVIETADCPDETCHP